MAALVTNFTTTYYYGAYFTYAALAIAVAILTLLTLPVMYEFFFFSFSARISLRLWCRLALSIVRKGAFTSMIIVELIWTGSCLWYQFHVLSLIHVSGLLWVLWLSTGGVTASTTWINYCSTFYCTFSHVPDPCSKFGSEQLAWCLDSVSQEACMETQALTAFAFLNWIFRMYSPHLTKYNASELDMFVL